MLLRIAELVIGRAGKTPAIAIVTIFADGVVVVDGLGESGSGIDGGLPVVDAAAVVIEGSAEEDSQLLRLSEAMADGAAYPRCWRGRPGCCCSRRGRRE